jgi:hypothetical protein
LAEHHDAYVRSGYFLGLQALFLLIVAAGLASLITGWLHAAALTGGAAAATLTAASAAGLLGATFTAERHVAPDAIWGVYEAHTWLLVAGSMPSAVLFGSVAIGTVLPRWLRWWAAAVAFGYLFGGLYPFGGELEGGVGGAAWFLALLLGHLWVVVLSVRSLVRRGGLRERALDEARPPEPSAGS